MAEGVFSLKQKYPGIDIERTFGINSKYYWD